MKHKQITLAEAQALARRDRNRLVIMALAVVVLGAGYVVTRFYGERYELEEERERTANVPDRGPLERIVTIEFDKPEVLEKVRDARPEDRVLEDTEPLRDVLDYARLQTRRHYDALGIRELTPEVYAELESDPGAHRVEPFRMRGEVVDLEPRSSPNRPDEAHGTLRLEDGRYAHFVVVELPAGTGVGDFVRVDGCFVKLFSREGEGGWMEGPLLASQKAEASVPRLGSVEGLEELLARVEDDRFDEDHIHTPPLPEDAKWGLMSYAASPASAELDWESAPELDTEVLARIYDDGNAYRGKPFRLSISRNQGSWTEAVGENPLRLEKLTTGWIGNMVWKGKVPVIQYIAPFDKPELQDFTGSAKLVDGRGFFLKNVFYERKDGAPGRVPLFVMQAIDVFTPVADGRTLMFMWGLLGGTLLLAGCFWLLLVRDKRSSRALQAELVRRRRARRGKAGDEGLELAES